MFWPWIARRCCSDPEARVGAAHGAGARWLGQGGTVAAMVSLAPASRLSMPGLACIAQPPTRSGQSRPLATEDATIASGSSNPRHAPSIFCLICLAIPRGLAGRVGGGGALGPRHPADETASVIGEPVTVREGLWPRLAAIAVTADGVAASDPVRRLLLS